MISPSPGPCGFLSSIFCVSVLLSSSQKQCAGRNAKHSALEVDAKSASSHKQSRVVIPKDEHLGEQLFNMFDPQFHL